MNNLVNTVITGEANSYALTIYTQTTELYSYLLNNPYYLKYTGYLINENIGFSKLFHWFIDLGAINVFSKNMLKVLFILLRHANYHNHIGRYNRYQIAREGDIFPQQVSSCMKQLTFAGIVIKTKKKRTLYYKLVTKPNQELINYLSFYYPKSIKTNKNRDPYTGRYKKVNTNTS